MGFISERIVLCGVLGAILPLSGNFGLIAQTHVADVQRFSVAVPFVGCKSDGQTGPVDPPDGPNISLVISTKDAEQLAYYKSAETIGVLAPRGWHCAATYGSGGDTLYVLPEPIDPSQMFSSQLPKMAGAAIQVSRRFGDTSGRYSVAEIIARIFPTRKQFVTKVMEMFDLPANSFPSGPYPTDTMRHKSETVAEYRTPPQTEGLGTYSWLGKNDRPIHGAAMLVGTDPDVLLLGVRVPEKMRSLIPTIVERFEYDAASVPIMQ